MSSTIDSKTNSLGQYIRELRGDRSYRDVARESGGLVSHTYVADLEKGHAPASSLSFDTIEGLARGLRVNYSEMLEQVRRFRDMERGLISDQAPTISQTNAVRARAKVLPVRGMATAGQPIDTESYLVPEESWRPGCEVYRVDGDSMTTADPDSLRDGDLVLVDTSLRTPVDNKILLVLIPGDGFTIKRVRKLKREWWLMSDNPDPQYTSFQPRDAKIIGTVYETFRRRKL